MRGRKPKPTQQRILEGNPGHRPLNAAEPQPPTTAETFDTPAELADDERAIAEWRRLAPMLRLIRQITDADRACLIACCLQWSRYLDATQKLKVSGMVLKSPKGYPIVNPYLGIANKALTACVKLWVELGLTPSSRSRVKTSDALPPADDDFAEFDARPN